MSAVAINNIATTIDPSIESLEKEIQSIFHHNNRADALTNNKELAKPPGDDDSTLVNPEVLITTTTMTTTTRSVQYNTTANYPVHYHPQQQQHYNGGTRLGRDRGDSITSDGYYSRNNSPLISYAKSDDGTQTEVEKESVHIQVPYLASEGVQTEPLVAEPEVIPTRAQAEAKVKQQKETRPRRKQFVDYVCDCLVFLQDCCTCNGVGGVL
jgi:hypothetical protein